MTAAEAFKAFQVACQEHQQARVALCAAEDRLAEASVAYAAVARFSASPRQVDDEGSREAQSSNPNPSRKEN